MNRKFKHMDLSRISKKSPHEDTRMTLSAIDCRTMESYNNYYSTLPEKKKLLAQLNRKKTGSRSKYSTDYHELCKKIDDLELEIYDIENRSHQINYLMKAAPHFLEYANSGKSKGKNDSQNTIPGDKSPSNQEVINGFFVTKDGTNRGKICQEYIKECIGDGYSLSTKSNELEINQKNSTRIIQIGSNLAGCARYLAGKYDLKVLAIELQSDLSEAASELTERCNLSDKVHLMGQYVITVTASFRERIDTEVPFFCNYPIAIKRT